MLKRLQFLALAMLLPICAFAQSGSITGKVTDAKTGEPLAGATAYIQSLQKGAQADLDGNYTISNLPSGSYALEVNYIGYRKFNTTVEVGSGTVQLDITLNLDLVGMEELVVTGYGTIDRASFTGTVSSVSADKFESVPVASVDAALQGQAPGVSISATSGTPGSTQDIRIRGISSINAGTSPLFVIDGVPVVNGNTSTNGGTSSLGFLSTLNTADIENITILKDAASTAPYGARGTNGVIVITTKSGREGNTTYSVSAQRGINNPAVDGPGALNAAQYDELYTEYLFNHSTGLGCGTTKAAIQANCPSGWDGVTDTDWGEEARNENAVQQEYNISARGGNATTNFYASMGIFDQEGPVNGSSVNRYTGSFDISHKLDDRVKFSNSLTGSFVEQDGILEGAGYFGSPILAEYFMLPIDKARNDDGTPNIDNLSTSVFNPLYIQENDIDRNRTYRLMNNSSLEVKINKNLTYTSKYAIDFTLAEEKNYNNIYYGDADSESGSVDDYTYRNFNYVWQNMLNYNWVPSSAHSFNFKVWNEIQKNYNFQVGGSGEGIATTGLFNLNTTAINTGWSYSSDWSVMSFTGLVNYGFQDKIFVDASFRQEGSSRFADDKRWGSFYSVGVGYVLSEEEFIKDIDFINFLKVRGSYGLTGNASVSLNSYQATVSYTGAYNELPAISTDNLGNKDLTWENAHSYDVGVEFEVLEKLSGSATFFRKNSYDLLFSVPLSRTSGHSSQTQNIGELYNQGFEFEANVDVVRTRDIKWNIGGNLTLLKNEVTDLPVDGNGEDIEIKGSTRYTAVNGYETGAWFMRKWAGVDPANGDPLWYIDGKGGATTNDYNAAEAAYQGASAMPTKFGGINTRVDVKDFYVSATLYYSFGNKVYDIWAHYLNADGRRGGAFGSYASQYDRWQAPGDNALNPKPIYGSNTRLAIDASTRRLYDGDYLRLKNLNIGYNVPAKYLENIGVKSASVYFLGQNLWTHTFDDLLKYDPEVPADGDLSLSAAPLKSVTVGIRANF
tara:strand:+ start:19760 stop:22801 length:3042 start_codon:yes stop_codon:yes gene_type:complete